MMEYTLKDLEILRPLAEAYAEEALSARARKIEREYRDLNALKRVRPPVLVFEEPWGELAKEEDLVLHCEGERARAMEWELRTFLYKCRRYRGDYIAPPYYAVNKCFSSTPLGISVEENIIHSESGSEIMSHGYHDVLKDEDDLEKVKIPIYSLEEEKTAAAEDFAGKVFGGLMPTKRVGHQLYMAAWDQIPRYHGVENCLIDLYDRPEFIHACMEKWTQIYESQIEQWEALELLEPETYYLHCTPGLTDELSAGSDGKVTAKNVWCRSSAQVFSDVSPAMHDEFDLDYTQRLFDRCGLSYYGCCEPLHLKIDNLRRFKNLRRISITPWADPDIAAEKIGSDYVFSCKTNPAFVAEKHFDPEPVRAEVRRVMAACKRNDTPCEFVLKDISTISGNPENLTRWVQTVNETIDEFD